MNILTSEQVAFFKDNGYLIIKGLLDKKLCSHARDRMWAALPEASSMKRDDPATYAGPFPDDEVSVDSLHIRQGFLWQLRECGTEQELINLMYSDHAVAIAEQLIGNDMVTVPEAGGEPMGSRGPVWPGGPTDPAIGDGIRGIYFTRPYGDRERTADQAHTDGQPFSLGMVGLIHDTPADGGAFRVWPGSHRRLYPTFQMQYDQPRIPYYDHMPSYKGIIQSDAYLEELKRIHDDTEPVDCYGEEGDVIFWHHRLAHMAGQNYSNVIRQAVLTDFTRKDMDSLRMDPPQEDMWRDWSDTVKASGLSYSEATAADQRLDR